MSTSESALSLSIGFTGANGFLTEIKTGWWPQPVSFPEILLHTPSRLELDIVLVIPGKMGKRPQSVAHSSWT